MVPFRSTFPAEAMHGHRSSPLADIVYMLYPNFPPKPLRPKSIGATITIRFIVMFSGMNWESLSA
jgi:hypothetical protein